MVDVVVLELRKVGLPRNIGSVGFTAREEYRRNPVLGNLRVQITRILNTSGNIYAEKGGRSTSPTMSYHATIRKTTTSPTRRGIVCSVWRSPYDIRVRFG